MHLPRLPRQPTAPYHDEYIPDVRSLPFNERKALKAGPTIKIFDGEQFTLQIPRKLFLAATTKPGVLQASQSIIRLPPDTGYGAVLSIGCCLLALAATHKSFNLRYTKDLESDLRICKAGRLLGMEDVLHIHNHYWWRFNNVPLVQQT
ncbi:hypothetical protein N0V90_000029 [Kalmusia sp. IMI 367209]|nr:hypothetical protein N0V90_000029 [Kalmusia sp. IMI 367209]